MCAYMYILFSMTWLKRQLRRLGLKRRVPDPPEDTMKTLIEVSLKAILPVCYQVCEVYSKAHQ